MKFQVINSDSVVVETFNTREEAEKYVADNAHTGELTINEVEAEA